MCVVGRMVVLVSFLQAILGEVQSPVLSIVGCTSLYRGIKCFGV